MSVWFGEVEKAASNPLIVFVVSSVQSVQNFFDGCCFRALRLVVVIGVVTGVVTGFDAGIGSNKGDGLCENEFDEEDVNDGTGDGADDIGVGIGVNVCDEGRAYLNVRENAVLEESSEIVGSGSVGFLHGGNGGGANVKGEDEVRRLVGLVALASLIGRTSVDSVN